MLAREGMTAEELFSLGSAAKRTELVGGTLVVREPAGLLHGEITARIATALRMHIEREYERTGAAHRRGRVLTADPGFTLARNPDTVRAPDIAYISRARWSAPLPVGFGEFAPDLAVEVRSPGERAGQLLKKIGDWLDAGTELVWLVDSQRRSVHAFAADGSITVFGIDDRVTAGATLPDFALPVREILEWEQ